MNSVSLLSVSGDLPCCDTVEHLCLVLSVDALWLVSKHYTMQAPLPVFTDWPCRGGVLTNKPEQRFWRPLPMVSTSGGSISWQ